MNVREAQAAFNELLAHAHGRIELALQQAPFGHRLHQRCVICGAKETLVLEVSAEGDVRTFVALRAFQEAHRHGE